MRKPLTRPALRHARPLIALQLILMTASTAEATADVYHCQVPGSPPVYSQFPCKTPRVPALIQERVSPQTLQVIEMPTLSAYQRSQLARAQVVASARQQKRRAGRTQVARKQQHERAARADRCRAASRQLGALAMQRRKGYALRDARRLAEQELALRQEADDNC